MAAFSFSMNEYVLKVEAVWNQFCADSRFVLIVLAAPLKSGGSLEWYCIVGLISAFILQFCTVGVGCYIYKRRSPGEWEWAIECAG